MTPEAKIWTENIKKVLTAVDEELASPEAVQMLLGTAARESRLGKVDTENRRTGIGPFQIIRTTEKDIWNNYLKYKPDIAKKIKDTTGVSGPSPDALENNFPYAAIIARLVYKRVPEDLPSASDVKAQAKYWKKWYNTHLGAGTADKFMKSYEEDIGTSGGEEDQKDMAVSEDAMISDSEETSPAVLPESEMPDTSTDTEGGEIYESDMIDQEDSFSPDEEPEQVDIVVADSDDAYDENEPDESDDAYAIHADVAEEEGNLMDMLSGMWGEVRDVFAKAVDPETADSIIDKLRYTVLPDMANEKIAASSAEEEENVPNWMEKIRRRVAEQKKLAGLDSKKAQFDIAMRKLGLPEERAAKWRELILEDLEG